MFRTPKFQKDVFVKFLIFIINQNYITLGIGKEVKLHIIGGN